MDSEEKYIIAAINGPWQLIAFITNWKLFSENIRPIEVLYYDIDDYLINICNLIASSFPEIRATRNFDLSKCRNNDGVVELWIGKLFTPLPKLIIDIYIDASVFVFEEGLHSYIKSSTLSIKYIYERYNRPRSFCYFFFNYCFKRNTLKIIDYFPNQEYWYHQRRVKARYKMLFNEDNQRVSKVLKEILIISYKAVSDSISMPVIEENSTVVIGQNFSDYDLLSLDDELNMYNHLISDALIDGRKVYWKSHPRTNEFTVYLKDKFKENLICIDSYGIPLEMLVIENKNIKLVGLSSSTLLYHHFFLEGESYQLASRLKISFNRLSPWYNEQIKVIEFIEQYIPSYTDRH